MNADSIEGPKAPKPALVLPIIGSSALIVLACLAVYFGPKLFRTEKTRMMAKDLGRLEKESDIRALFDLITLNWPEADKALRRYAEASPTRAWNGTTRTLAVAKKCKFVFENGNTFRIDESIAAGGEQGVPVVFCYRHKAPTKTMERTYGVYHSGVEIKHLSWVEDQLHVEFALNETLSKHFGLAGGQSWATHLSLAELSVSCEAPQGIVGDEVLVNLPGCIAPLRLKKAAMDRLALYHVEAWLRKAGALPLKTD